MLLLVSDDGLICIGTLDEYTRKPFCTLRTNSVLPLPGINAYDVPIVVRLERAREETSDVVRVGFVVEVYVSDVRNQDDVSAILIEVVPWWEVTPCLQERICSVVEVGGSKVARRCWIDVRIKLS